MVMLTRSPRSDGSCSFRQITPAERGVALGLCLLLFISIFTLIPYAADYSYTEYNFDSDLITAYFTSGKITATISAYTSSSSTVTNVILTDYYVDSNGWVWFYNPQLDSQSDVVRKSNGQFLFNVYIDLGFNFYLPPQTLMCGCISSYPNTTSAYIDNSKLNLVRGSQALYTINSDGYFKTFSYDTKMPNFPYFSGFLGAAPYNFKSRVRVEFSPDEYYGDESQYFDNLNFNFNVTSSNSYTYYIPMIGLRKFDLLILDDVGAPTQGTNHIVNQLDQIKDLVSSGNATAVQISDAVTNINNSINVPTTQQVELESMAESLAGHEVSDIAEYSDMVDQVEEWFDSNFNDVETAEWSTDEVMPSDNNWLNSFFDHRIFYILFPVVGICALAAFFIHGRW